MFRWLMMSVILFSLVGCQLEGESSVTVVGNTHPDDKENNVGVNDGADEDSSAGVSDAPSDILESSVLVYVTAGAIQCDYKGRPPLETAQLLVNEGIDVLSSACGVTDMAYISVCGASTGEINLHEINASNLGDAKAIGFGPVSELLKMGVGYRAIACQR